MLTSIPGTPVSSPVRIVVAEPTSAQYLQLRRTCVGASREEEVEDLPKGHIMSTSDTFNSRYLMIEAEVRPRLGKRKETTVLWTVVLQCA